VVEFFKTNKNSDEDLCRKLLKSFKEFYTGLSHIFFLQKLDNLRDDIVSLENNERSRIYYPRPDCGRQLAL
jgi:hypothetical protein